MTTVNNPSNYHSYGGANEDLVAQQKALSMSIRGNFGTQDPEGVEALNAIDEFEAKHSKKANRYPKNQLE